MDNNGGGEHSGFYMENMVGRRSALLSIEEAAGKARLWSAWRPRMSFPKRTSSSISRSTSQTGSPSCGSYPKNNKRCCSAVVKIRLIIDPVEDTSHAEPKNVPCEEHHDVSK
jgi:hypothetical protein